MDFLVITLAVVDFFLSLILIFYLVFTISWLLTFIIGKVPPLPSSSRAIRFLLDIIKERGNTPKVFVDLGSGFATVLIEVKKNFPQMEVIGYENWPTQFLLAKLMLFLSGTKAKVIYKDLFKADLKNADIVFCYLFPNFMEKIEAKFEKELKPGALAISSTFQLPNWKPIRTIITNEKRPDSEKICIYAK